MHKYLGTKRGNKNLPVLMNDQGEYVLDDNEKAELFSLKYREIIGFKDPTIKSDVIVADKNTSKFVYSICLLHI